MHKDIYLILEGDDDIRFFRKIIEPLFIDNGCGIHYSKQSKRKKRACGRFIQTIEDIEDWDYIYAKDIDVFPCAQSRKRKIREELSDLISEEKILIISKVIESWYLAGANERTMRSLGIHPENIKKIIRSTDNIDKAKFYEFFPRNRSNIEIMNSLLDNYDLEIAKHRNQSFNYFIEKFIKKLLS